MAKLGSLQRIRLQGFRSIREMDLALQPLNVLIGPNGAGKSNFISFFRFMNKLLEKDLQLHVQQQGGADRLLHFGKQTTSALALELCFAPGTYQAKLLASVDDRLIFEAEQILPSQHQQAAALATPAASAASTASQALSAGDRETTLLSPGNGGLADDLSQALSDWKPYHFHDTSETAKVKGAASLHDTARLRPQAENLAAFLYGIRNTQAFVAIVSTIQRVAPFFQGFVFEPEPRDLIRLRWKHCGSDAYFDASMLSDGSLRFICLATLLLQPQRPSIILLDEPELGLHPYAVQLLAAMMQSASVDSQIVAATQSVTLANEFAWQDIVVVDQLDNASRLRRLEQADVAHWLADYRVGELWEMNLLGGTP